MVIIMGSLLEFSSGTLDLLLMVWVRMNALVVELMDNGLYYGKQSLCDFLVTKSVASCLFYIAAVSRKLLITLRHPSAIVQSPSSIVQVLVYAVC